MIQYFEIDKLKTLQFVSEPLPARLRDYHEIMWIQEGKADFIIDGDFFHVGANSFFILPKDRYHQFLPKEIVSGRVIRFNEDDIDQFPRTLFSKFNDLSQVKINATLSNSFNLLFKLIEYEFNNVIANHHVMRHLLKALIWKLDEVRSSQFSGNSKSKSLIDIFDKFQLLLDEHICENRKVSFYANYLNTTPRKLGHIVKGILNNSTEQVIAKRLLTEAKKQLAYTEKSISQIAYDIGFEDNSYFTKFFRKLTGMTPKIFRDLHTPE